MWSFSGFSFFSVSGFSFLLTKFTNSYRMLPRTLWSPLACTWMQSVVLTNPFFTTSVHKRGHKNIRSASWCGLLRPSKTCTFPTSQYEPTALMTSSRDAGRCSHTCTSYEPCASCTWWVHVSWRKFAFCNHFDKHHYYVNSIIDVLSAALRCLSFTCSRTTSLPVPPCSTCKTNHVPVWLLGDGMKKRRTKWWSFRNEAAWLPVL